MAVQKIKKQLNNQQATEQIKEIYQNFLYKIERIEKVRDEKIATIIKKSEQRQIEKIKQEFQQF